MVADGIGGHSSGEIASNTAKTMIPSLLLASPPSASETTRRLRAALEDAGQAIYAESLSGALA
jgi:serine/threonine protein phosphatase PrpC